MSSGQIPDDLILFWLFFMYVYCPCVELRWSLSILLFSLLVQHRTVITYTVALFEHGFDQIHFIFNCLLSVVEFSAGVSTDKLDAKRPETKHRVEGTV